MSTTPLLRCCPSCGSFNTFLTRDYVTYQCADCSAQFKEHAHRAWTPADAGDLPESVRQVCPNCGSEDFGSPHLDWQSELAANECYECGALFDAPAMRDDP